MLFDMSRLSRKRVLTRGSPHRIINSSLSTFIYPHLFSLTHSFPSDLAMVAHNPLFSGRWTLEKFQATVINDIWPETAFFTLIALSTCCLLPVSILSSEHNSTVVSLVSELTPHKLEISGALLTVLGTVLGLVISFRTSSAYER